MSYDQLLFDRHSTALEEGDAIETWLESLGVARSDECESCGESFPMDEAERIYDADGDLEEAWIAGPNGGLCVDCDEERKEKEGAA